MNTEEGQNLMLALVFMSIAGVVGANMGLPVTGQNNALLSFLPSGFDTVNGTVNNDPNQLNSVNFDTNGGSANSSNFLTQAVYYLQVLVNAVLSISRLVLLFVFGWTFLISGIFSAFPELGMMTFLLTGGLAIAQLFFMIDLYSRIALSTRGI